MDTRKFGIALGTAVVLATLSFCISFVILVTVFPSFGSALADARRGAGILDPVVQFGYLLAYNASFMALVGALASAGLAAGITLVIAIMVQRAKP